jgi:hypothetical protein
VTTTTSNAGNGIGNIRGIFGIQGENNVRVQTPSFNFAYDLA